MLPLGRWIARKAPGKFQLCTTLPVSSISRTWLKFCTATRKCPLGITSTPAQPFGWPRLTVLTVELAAGSKTTIWPCAVTPATWPFLRRFIP